MSVHTPRLESVKGQVELLRTYREGLLNDTLPFWFPRCVDTLHGGFLHLLDRDGAIIDDDKSVWAQGRMAWMLMTLYNVYEHRPEWQQWAEQGLKFIEKHCFDRDGRMFFHVARDGTPIRKRRYAYSESFAAIAFAAHYKATADARSAERAVQLFEQFVRWNFTPGLMPPKFTDARPFIGLAPRMITLVTAQELRANLGEDPSFYSWIDRCIGEIERLFVKPDLEVVMESVSPEGAVVDHADGRLLNPGHAIEGAWFILWEGKYRNDSQLIRLGCNMLDWMWNRGWDQKFGGLYYFRDVFDRPVQEYWHDMKFWWPHNEAIIATLLAYLLTGNSRYALWHDQVHRWSYEHFADPEFGEWFGYLHRDGTPSNHTKGSLWKSFFHFPRMQWICWQLLQESLSGTSQQDSKAME
jgi:N-acylglucosamine 2-epimerase